MAITESKNNVNTNTSKIQFICPVCKTKKSLEIPKSVIEEAKQLITMSISRGLVCEHQFQAFVDKNFQVRGYQKVDFEIENKSNQENDSNFCNFRKNDNELFENLVLEGNFVKYIPKIKKTENHKTPSYQNKMTLEEIYNEFKEFIDEDNEKFKKFIDKDSKRIQTLPVY